MGNPICASRGPPDIAEIQSHIDNGHSKPMTYPRINNLQKNKYVYMYTNAFALTSHRDTIVRAIVVALSGTEDARNVSDNARCAGVVLSWKEIR